jgi:hypothetical protein
VKLRPLLLAVLVAISVVFTVPAAAQPVEDPNAACVLFPGQGYLCESEEFGIIVCPTGEEAEEGETISCFSIDTRETLDCLVLVVIDEVSEQFLLVHCTPADDPLGPEPDQEQPGGVGGASPITQEGEQESEAGEIDQSFDVS